MKRTIFVGSSSFPGSATGISQSVYAQILALHQAGYEILCFCPSTKKEGPINQLKAIATVHCHGPSSDPRTELFLMIKEYNKVRPKLIINNDNPYVSNLMVYADCPKISFCHMNKSNIYKLVVNDSSVCDVVGAISHFMMGDLKKKIASKEKVSLFPNIFVPPFDALNCEHKESIVGEPGKVKLVYAGGSNLNKGISYIKSLLAKLNDSSLKESVEVHLFGQYNDKDRSFIAQLSSLSIVFHGFVSSFDFYKALIASDILLFPSLNEGLPMTIIEAMSAKMAVLSIDGVGGVSDLVLNGFNGLCVDEGDWIELSLAYIGMVINAPSKLNRLKENSFLIFDSNFSSGNFVRNLENVFSLTMRHSTESKMNIDCISFPRGKVRLLSWHRIPRGSENYNFLVGLRQRLGMLASRVYGL